jgi:hypothetical protein
VGTALDADLSDRVFAGQTGSVQLAAYTPDGTRLVIADADRTYG